MITEKEGNLLYDDADVLICTTNCVGVMGKGIAKDFKNKYPKQVKEYVEDCNDGSLLPGDCRFYPLEQIFGHQRYWGAICTKNHWKKPSQYEWILNGCDMLAFNASFYNMQSVAIPPLGCGNGGLDWRIVYPIIKDVFRHSYLDVRVYIP